MPPDPLGTLVPASRAKNGFGILFGPPNHKNAARSLHELNFVHLEVSFFSLKNYFRVSREKKFSLGLVW